MEQKLLEEWQERLGLQDWIIALRYNCKFEDMELENVNGETEWSTSTKDALIRILDPNEHGDRIESYDFEQILVHELLHLKFAVLDCEKGSYESKVMEVVRHQLIDDLARALVMAKRGETKRKFAPGVKQVKPMHQQEPALTSNEIDNIVAQSRKAFQEAGKSLKNLLEEIENNG